MKVVIFGATGPTGQHITQQALAAGHQVCVVVRTPSKVTERQEKLKVLRGDAYDADSVAQAVAGQDVVVSSLGVPYTFKPVTIYSVGVKNILAAMKSQEVRRFIGITSGGTHPGRDPNHPFFFTWILRPFFGRTLYNDMKEMERIVMASDVDWTLLRPPRLLNKPATGRVRIAPDEYSIRGGTTISRADLAMIVVAQLTSNELLRRAAAVSG